MDTLYLLVATGFLFGAGFFAGRKVFPHLHAKQLAVILLAALTGLMVLWTFLNLAGRRAATPTPPPATEQPLQPDSG